MLPPTNDEITRAAYAEDTDFATYVKAQLEASDYLPQGLTADALNRVVEAWKAEDKVQEESENG